MSIILELFEKCWLKLGKIQTDTKGNGKTPKVGSTHYSLPPLVNNSYFHPYVTFVYSPTPPHLWIVHYKQTCIIYKAEIWNYSPYSDEVTLLKN